jgi:ABC-type sugar transport system permease subunit
MGYASAMGWVLFVISIVLALAIMRWSKAWVHYEAS